MRVLGLDPSLTNFGWAVHDTGLDACSGRGRFQTPSSMLFIDRYTQLRESLRELIHQERPDRVGLESSVFNEYWSEGMYGLFLYSCEALRQEGMDVVLFTPPQIKAHAHLFLRRPKGWQMKKPDMVEATKKRTKDKKRWNHNEADAYWCAICASRFWLLRAGDIVTEDLTSVEKHQFTFVKTYQRGKKAGTTEKRGIIYRENDRFFLWSEGVEDHVLRKI